MNPILGRPLRPVFSLFDLTGRVAVVTGGAGLLGAEFCHTLAEAGAKVVVADLNLANANAVAEKLAADGAQAIAIHTDVTNADSVRSLMEAALSNFKHIDILINSAAIDPKFDPQHVDRSLTGAFEDFPLSAWDTAVQVNLTGTYLCCQAAAHTMVTQGSGVMVNISSIYGLVAPDQRLYQRPDQPPQFKPVDYSVTKAGLLGLTRYLATYYAGKNIRVNALTPGGVFNGHDPIFVRAYSERTPLGRMAKKDEMNGALLFLASDASAYMTGANLVVDGGWTAW